MMRSNRNKLIIGALCAVVLVLLAFVLKPQFSGQNQEIQNPERSLASTAGTPDCTWNEGELTNFSGVVSRKNMHGRSALQNISVLEFTAVNLINNRITYILGLYNTESMLSTSYGSYPSYPSYPRSSSYPLHASYPTTGKDSFDLGARFEMEVVNGNMKRYRQALLSSSREVFNGVWQNPDRDATLTSQMNSILQLAEDMKQQCYQMKGVRH